MFYISQNYAYAILRPLQQVILARGDRVAWFLEGDEVSGDYLTKNESRLVSIPQVKAFKADVVFVPGNTVPSFISGLKVAVFHGFNAGKLNRRGFEDHFNIRGCFDLYCTQGPSTTGPFNKLAQQKKHFSVIETGWPALDPLFNKSNKRAVKDLSQYAGELKNNSECKQRSTILFCSTFSRKLTAAPVLFETIKRLSETGKWQWLIQLHPKMPLEIVARYKSIESEHLTFVETDNVLPLLKTADVMVCDTSSILIMFLMLGKPVVTFNNISPKDYLIDIDDPAKLEGSIELALSPKVSHLTNIKRFINDTHPYNDGKSSERVLSACDALLDGKHLPIKKKPLNLTRRLKMRRKLSYWGR